MHTCPVIDREEFTPAHYKYLRWVENELELSKEKMSTFEALFKPPFCTVELIESIFSVVSSVFDTENPAFNFEFQNDDLKDDFEEFRSEKLKDKTWVQNEGLKALKENPCGFIVVDLPEVQTTTRPEPYFYFLPIEKVINVISPDGVKVDLIIFVTDDLGGGKKEVAAFDNEFYSKFIIDEENEILTQPEQTPHFLGETPVRAFWDKPLNDESYKLTKSTPVTNSLTSLDFLLFFAIGKEHSNLYDFFPILWTYPERQAYDADEYTEEDLRQIAEMYEAKDRHDMLSRLRKPSPTKKMRGAGSLIEKPMPDDDMPDIGDPIGRMASDVKLLEFINKDLAKREDKIFYAAVGKTAVGDFGKTSEGDTTATEIKASFESRRKILMNIKASFESLHKWILSTVAKLRYTEGQFLSASINYGNEFFLFTHKEAEMAYLNAKEKGMPESEIIGLLLNLIHTKFKNEPEKRERAKLLLKLEPYPTRSTTEAAKLAKDGLISKLDFVVKSNFHTFISRFEDENGNLLIFGESLSPAEKVKAIKEGLREYAQEINLTPQQIEDNENSF